VFDGNINLAKLSWTNTDKILTKEMGTNTTTKTSDAKQTGIKCIQVNLQHCRAATANLMTAVAEDETDIIFIQDPHTIQSKVLEISTKYKIFTSGKDRCRAAVVATNNQIDAMLIHQLSDADMVAVQIINGNTKIIAASMYFDRENQIEHDLDKTESILHHAKNTGVLIASDCNARSTLWHDELTNATGRILEEFIASRQLYILS
jgi:ribosomal protein L18